MAKTAADLVAEAKQRIQNLTVDQTAEELERGTCCSSISVSLTSDKSTARYQALSMHRGACSSFGADPHVTDHRAEFDLKIGASFCTAGGGGRSALAAETLQQMGYANVAHLDGGFKAWKAAEPAGSRICKQRRPLATEPPGTGESEHGAPRSRHATGILAGRSRRVRSRRRPHPPVRAVVCRGAGGGGPRAERDGAGDGISGRRTGGAIVLLKGFDERGFLFYSNYESPKGRDLAQNPRAALTFYWPQLERQVRIGRGRTGQP